MNHRSNLPCEAAVRQEHKQNKASAVLKKINQYPFFIRRKTLNNFAEKRAPILGLNPPFKLRTIHMIMLNMVNFFQIIIQINLDSRELKQYIRVDR